MAEAKRRSRISSVYRHILGDFLTVFVCISIEQFLNLLTKKIAQSFEYKQNCFLRY